MQDFYMNTQIKKYYFELDGNQGSLTNREWICLRHLVKNYSARQIAEKLNLSPKTIETYLRSIRMKLTCNSYQELCEKALEIFPFSLLYGEQYL